MLPVLKVRNLDGHSSDPDNSGAMLTFHLALFGKTDYHVSVNVVAEPVSLCKNDITLPQAVSAHKPHFGSVCTPVFQRGPHAEYSWAKPVSCDNIMSGSDGAHAGFAYPPHCVLTDHG